MIVASRDSRDRPQGLKEAAAWGWIAGFRGMSVLSRRGADGVEFMVITRWDTLEAIMTFAGDDAESAVVPDNVQRMMRDFDLRARHYEEELSSTP